MVWKSDFEKKIEALTDQLKEYSPDLELLERRMIIFNSIHGSFIESGIERLAFWQYPLYQNSCRNSMKKP